jgi:protein associated with RNAse G/E
LNLHKIQTKIINNNSKPILFADDKSIIATYTNSTGFKNDISTVFECMNVWFKVNLLSSNFEETYYIQLTTKNYSFADMDFD